MSSKLLTSYVLLEVTHEKPIPDLAHHAAARVQNLDGIGNGIVTAIPVPETVYMMARIVNTPAHPPQYNVMTVHIDASMDPAFVAESVRRSLGLTPPKRQL